MNKKLNFQNKKGDVPITLLVIGVFAICTLALLTFFIADFKMSNSFVGVTKMQQMNAAIDEYLWYKNKGISEETLDKLFNFTYEDGIKYFYFEQTYNKDLFARIKGEDTLIFSAKYPVPN
ncbi:hypothetical protein GW932_02090 [archaeon]|nr:hypothetical protein [archaeon]